MRMALGVAYEGSGFHGWQSQPDRINVQDTLQAALSQFVAQPISVICAGRTDAGVHARQQVVHFDSPVSRPEHSWVRGTNAFLPPSVRVLWACEVPEDFHARHTAIGRSYEYLLQSAPVRSPFDAGRVGWTFYELDLEAMQAACARLIGEHDFSSFRASECQAKTPVKDLQICQVASGEQPGSFRFQFRANGFLHHMVRNIMGCMIMIGDHRKPVDWIEELLEAKNRSLAAPTFMPDGLYFLQPHYPDGVLTDVLEPPFSR